MTPWLATCSPKNAPENEVTSDKRRRPWRQKFHDALRGLKLGIRGHSSFFVHFFLGALVLAAGWALQCQPLEWCILLGCIGLVLIAELFNSAIETISHSLNEPAKSRARSSRDIAAGGVLLAGITAAVLATIIFIYRLLVLFS